MEVLSEYAVYTYKGKEGWENYMRDIVRIGKPFYSIGAQVAWLDERVKSFFPTFMKEMNRKKLLCIIYLTKKFLRKSILYLN